MLTKAEADAILAEPKVITANISWRSLPAGGGRRFLLETSVLVPSKNLLLKLYGRVGKTNYSFALVHAGDPIRKLTAHARHHNPGCEWLTQTHIHIWDEANEDGQAYIPSEIITSDVHQALHDFLKECNINLRGTYKPFMV